MLIVERYFPAGAGIALFGALYYFGDVIVAGSNNNTLNLSILYSAVFDWSAIQTGFLFGIIGFIAGKNDGFIKELQDTPQMGYFHSYQKSAIALGFLITFTSIPLMVTGMTVLSVDGWRYLVFCAWASVSLWAFFAFVRVAYIFGIIIRVRDKRRVNG